LSSGQLAGSSSAAQDSAAAAPGAAWQYCWWFATCWPFGGSLVRWADRPVDDAHFSPCAPGTGPPPPPPPSLAAEPASVDCAGDCHPFAFGAAAPPPRPAPW